MKNKCFSPKDAVKSERSCFDGYFSGRDLFYLIVRKGKRRMWRFYDLMQSLVQKGMVYANAAKTAAGEEQKPATISWFELRALTTEQIVFYVIVAVVTVAVVVYLVWRTTKSYMDSFKETDIPVETIKLHVRTEEEKKTAQEKEEEMTAFVNKKRYIKGRK